MLNKPYPFEEFKNILTPAQAVGIFLNTDPRFDQVAAALALKLSLEKMGKSVSVISSMSMIVEFSHLVGVETVSKKSNQGKDLVISLSYPLDQIEKVSYNDNGGTLNLVVQPKIGAPRMEKDQAQFSYEGGEQDLQICIGVTDINSLGEVNDQIKTQNLVNIDQVTANAQFGKLSIIDSRASSCSEMVISLLANLNLPVDVDIANNLYLGLENATGNFAFENVGADTFEAAAICLRWGAKRLVAPQIPLPVKPVLASNLASNKTQVPPRPQFLNQSQPNRIVSKPPQPQATNSPALTPASPAPSDWLEPKIFKSSNIS